MVRSTPTNSVLAIFRKGFGAAAREHLDVLRALFRHTNLLDLPGALFARQDLLGKVLASYEKHKDEETKTAPAARRNARAVCSRVRTVQPLTRRARDLVSMMSTNLRRAARIAVVMCAAGLIADVTAATGETGEFTLPNGERSQVPFESLDYTGVARFVWPDGRSYAGDFVDGKPHGYGIEQMPDGATYDGAWADGNRNGAGTARYADGSRYDGAFEQGVRSGQGLFQSAGGRYRGNWADDAPNGDGRLEYADGATYEGSWGGGRRNGFGTYVRVDGSRYDGDWQNDVPDGFGHLAGADATTYDGGWRGGQRSGYGAADFGDGFGYEGTWVANVRQGYGREQRGEAGDYTGEWTADARSGHGVQRGPRGSFCDATWANNVVAGPGTCRSDEGVEITGAWHDEVATNGVIKLRGGATYEGKLYDPDAQTVDASFVAWLQRAADDGDPTAALLLERRVSELSRTRAGPRTSRPVAVDRGERRRCGSPISSRTTHRRTVGTGRTRDRPAGVSGGARLRRSQQPARLSLSGRPFRRKEPRRGAALLRSCARAR